MKENSHQYKCLIDAIKEQAKLKPEKIIFRFITADHQEHTLTAKQLDLKATKLAEQLLLEGASEERVLLSFLPGLRFVEAFVACLYAGAIPVPVATPKNKSDCHSAERLQKIINDCSPALHLVDPQLSEFEAYKVLETANPDLKSTVSKAGFDLGGGVLPKTFPREKVAFLQYTSGSTRDPRGVCTTYLNLSVQSQFTKECFELDEHTKMVFWMPHFHDYSLIGGIIQALYGNGEFIFFSPVDFIKRPSVWGEVITKHKATFIAAPNFGYHLLASRSKESERRHWDFSTVKVAVCAAEPVKPKSMDYFFLKLGECGFDPSAFSPSYGLAEHTVAISTNGKKRFMLSQSLSSGDPDATTEIEVVGCGKPGPNIVVKIVDPVSFTECKSQTAGEIWVHSQNVAAGYFNRQIESLEKFQAKIRSDSRAWLRTGDMGLLVEGELVILGRIDDMFILNGKNHFPSDLEDEITSCHRDIRPGRVVVFGRKNFENYGDSEEIVTLLETSTEEARCYREICKEVRKVLQREIGFAKASVGILARGHIPKTTSGKLQRSKARKEWLQGHFPVVFSG